MHQNEADGLVIRPCNIDFRNQRTQIDHDDQRLCLSKLTNDFTLFAPKRGCMHQREAEGLGIYICPCNIDFEISAPKLTKITGFPS
jgi:hypothetical protein